jgi:hypothetical protein
VRSIFRIYVSVGLLVPHQIIFQKQKFGSSLLACLVTGQWAATHATSTKTGAFCFNLMPLKTSMRFQRALPIQSSPSAAPASSPSPGSTAAAPIKSTFRAPSLCTRHCKPALIRLHPRCHLIQSPGTRTTPATSDSEERCRSTTGKNLAPTTSTSRPSLAMFL